jgi:hypothetical protein
MRGPKKKRDGSWTLEGQDGRELPLPREFPQLPHGAQMLAIADALARSGASVLQSLLVMVMVHSQLEADAGPAEKAVLDVAWVEQRRFLVERWLKLGAIVEPDFAEACAGILAEEPPPITEAMISALERENPEEGRGWRARVSGRFTGTDLAAMAWLEQEGRV